MNSLPEQVVQLRELIKVCGGEEVGPQHHEVVFALFGTLFFDENATVLEHGVIRFVVFLGGLHDRECLDLGLSRVVYTAIKVAVSVGWCCRREQSSEHGYLLGGSGMHRY